MPAMDLFFAKTTPGLLNKLPEGVFFRIAHP